MTIKLRRFQSSYDDNSRKDLDRDQILDQSNIYLRVIHIDLARQKRHIAPW